VITITLEKSEKRFIVGRLQTKNLEPYPKPWILPRESLKVTATLLGNSIGALLGSLFCVVVRAGGIPILNPNGTY